MSNAQDIKSVLAAIKFLGKLGAAVKSSLEDGKITWTDGPNFLSSIVALPGFISAIPDVPTELADEITDEEKAEITAALISLGLLEGEAEAAAVDGVKIAIDLKNYIFKYFVK